jgi:hypothetical protein
MPIKKLGILFLFIVLTCRLFAQQQTADIGLFIGGGIPITDYDKTYLGQSLNLEYGVYYRYNYNSRFSLRINGVLGSIGASGELVGYTSPIQFKKKVFDLDAMLEINYLDFLIGVPTMKFSPFVFTGLGLTFYPDKNNTMTITPNIPIGIGAKYAFSKYFSVGAEASLHKLMNDGLDNLDNPYSTNGLIKVNDIAHNNDWISYFGLTLTYKFYSGKKACPAYNTIN